jgi:hypothetical protein
MVPYAAIAAEVRSASEMTRWANSRLVHRSINRDHLVGASE